ncbi:MAG TPA: hypothetical protein VHD90_27035, partial [Phototrophicaceae bacterium]|nr:hypothetical protein [Phototrophicaceae bacterium]
KAVPMNAGPELTALFQDMCSQIYTNASHLPLVTKGHIVAFRKDLITAIIQPTEVSSNFLKNIAQFTVLNPQ